MREVDPLAIKLRRAGWRPADDQGPGRLPRDLNPSPGFTLDAPRASQPIEDDFTAQVTVLPFPRPGPRSSYTNGAGSYHGAGLFVWGDERNLLRFEVAGLAQTGDGKPLAYATES